MCWIDATASYVGLVSPSTDVLNHTTKAPPTDGSSTWLLAQCISGCPIFDTDTSAIYLNFTDIPTTSLSSTDQTWDLAFLTCKPNSVIETREIRNEGQGVLTTITPSSDQQLTSQGNLHPVQTPSLLSIVLSSMSANGGPLSQLSGTLGTQVQTDFLFGQEQSNEAASNTNQITNLTMLPLSNLTTTYTQMLQSASKGVFLTSVAHTLECT